MTEKKGLIELGWFGEMPPDDSPARTDSAVASPSSRTASQDAGSQGDRQCAVCGWPLAMSTLSGCVRGNCSMRPLPKRHYDPERAQAEYRGTLPASQQFIRPRPYRDEFPEHTAALARIAELEMRVQHYEQEHNLPDDCCLRYFAKAEGR